YTLLYAFHFNHYIFTFVSLFFLFSYLSIFFLFFFFFFFFFNDPATTEIYTLSLHDALPILANFSDNVMHDRYAFHAGFPVTREADRKSTRLNSSHRTISYAVFCLKKKKKKKK